jgi:hypothetical protein
MVRLALAIPRGKTTRQSHNPVRLSPTRQAQEATRSLAEPDAWDAAYGVAKAAANLLDTSGCVKIRDVFGNPFRAVALDPDHVSAEAARLALSAYERRDSALLPILGDALEEAGGTDNDLLSHLRSPGPHVRGCWALDLCLGLN